MTPPPSDVPQIVSDLREKLGAKLVTYIAGASKTQEIWAWADGVLTPSSDVMQALRAAHQGLELIEQNEGAGIAAAWFQGMNPHLGDLSPARVLRERRTEEARAEVLGAANSFVGA